jgi:hypothetical protein
MNQNPNEKPGQQNQGGQASVDAQLVKLIRKARSVGCRCSSASASMSARGSK